MHYVIGIDMSKRSFHAAFDESTVRVFENSPEGIDSFVTHLTALGANKDNTLIGVEATGAYHLFFCARCVKAGLQVRVINPLEAWHVIRAASLRIVKTDRADALAIRRMTAQGIRASLWGLGRFARTQDARGGPSRVGRHESHDEAAPRGEDRKAASAHDEAQRLS